MQHCQHCPKTRPNTALIKLKELFKAMKPEMKGQSTLPFDTWVLLLGTGLVKRMSLPG